MDKKEIIKNFYEKIFSNNNQKEFPNFVSENCTLRIGEKIILIGLNGMLQHMIDVRKTYPDLKIRIIKQHCDGDYVVSEFIAEGTHQGEWLGMKPTGKKLTFTGVNIDKIENNKITEHGGAVNTFETLFEEQIIQPSH